MLDLKLKSEAEDDLSKIFEYTFFHFGLNKAEKYQDELFAGMQLISKEIEFGKKYTFSKSLYRKLHINRHLIFFRIENKTCIIIRVLHDSVDINFHLNK